jgi:hypothetical protein
MSKNDDLSRKQSIVAGLVGSVAGLMVMRLYWQKVAPLVNEHLSQEPIESDQLNDISVVGKQYQKDESSTAALGRIAYEKVTGNEPDDNTKEILSYATHWLFGLLQGGTFGGLQRGFGGPDVVKGLIFGTALWLFGDETAVPALGLQKGPTAASPAQHVNRFGAHLAYGLGTAVAAQLLRRMM